MVKVLAFFLLNVFISVASQDNTICRPFPVMVPTDSTNDNFIIVHQCRGRAKSPVNNQNMQCVNTTFEPLENQMINGEQVYNHTSCNMSTVCQRDQDGSVENLRSGICYFHERWNADTCKCEMKNKKNQCKPNPEPSTNRGVTSSYSIGLNVVIMALVGEFIVLISIVYIIYRWRANKNSSTYDANEDIPFEREISLTIA